jgi:NAD-dependent DNA ligase
LDPIINFENEITNIINNKTNFCYLSNCREIYFVTKIELIDCYIDIKKENVYIPLFFKDSNKIDHIIPPEDINIEYVTGYNGFYIESNKIGKGTKVEIIRSGDVIPVIRSVLESTEAIFPQEEYEWDTNHVELIITNKDNKSYLLKKMIYFFKGLNIPMLGGNYIEKLYNNGYDSIEKILLIKEEELETLKNISIKTSKKFYDKIRERMLEITRSELLSLLNYLGRGYSVVKIKNIEKEYPNLFDFQEDINTKRKNLEKINKKNAEHICEGLKLFEEFLKKIEIF